MADMINLHIHYIYYQGWKFIICPITQHKYVSINTIDWRDLFLQHFQFHSKILHPLHVFQAETNNERIFVKSVDTCHKHLQFFLFLTINIQAHIYIYI